MNERDRLYKKITSDTAEALVLARMRLHGFWPASEPLPPDPPDEVAERARIEAEIARLGALRESAKDPKKALAEEHKRRIEESRKRRAELRARRTAEAEERRAAWREKKQSALVHAGLGVSAGLTAEGTAEGTSRSELEALTNRGLPVMHSAADVATRLGIPLSKLRWLTYHRAATALVHYHRYGIPKKLGGIRSISAPKPMLARAQRWIFVRILSRISSEPFAHGFVRGRSIASNAAPHVGRKVVINLDLKDFFPTITFGRVKGLFRSLGYIEPVATVLALLCTEPPRVAAEYRGRVYAVALGSRSLPQGACTSPAITNAICRRLDRRLAGLAARSGFTYTRYADDLTFSGDDTSTAGTLLATARLIATQEGFREHPDKTRVMRRGGRQEVTGVTVNDRPGPARSEVRKLRAILHNVQRFGLESQNREAHPDFAAYLRGRVAYIAMLDPVKRASLETALDRALAAPR